MQGEGGSASFVARDGVGGDKAKWADEREIHGA